MAFAAACADEAYNNEVLHERSRAVGAVGDARALFVCLLLLHPHFSLITLSCGKLD